MLILISDPVSRKSKSSGRNKSGFCVYLAYQLFDNVTHNQMVGEALNQCVDITIKQKQLLKSLTEAKIPPQIDEKVRKSIKEVIVVSLKCYFIYVLQIKITVS